MNPKSSLIEESPLKTINQKNFDIKDYKLIQQIGEGTYGKIYKVLDRFGNKYALKKIICHNKSELRITKKEFLIMDNYPHDNIIKIEGISEKILDETTYALYVLLELADYDWVEEVTKRSKFSKYYKENELISIIKQLTSSLSFLQKNKIVHRDIKPQNILIFNLTYKLADFGEAKQSYSNRQISTLRGTELYMSPILFEKLKTDENAASSSLTNVKHNVYKSDVFSFGYCIIYAATLTFESLGYIRELNEMKEIENILIKQFKRRYSNKFIQLLLKIIDFDEKRRFDFIELEEYINKEF